MADGRDINIRIKIDPDRQNAETAKRGIADIGREALRSGTPLSSLAASLRSVNPASLAAAAGIGVLVAGVAIAVGIVRGLISVTADLASNLLDVGSRFQSLRVQLETATGSLGAANAQFERIKEFAAKTPFEVDSITAAYIRLRNVGINPTTSDLESFGNIAAANSRDITDFAEAVVGAITGEMERLKAFGIVARQEGEKVRFIFRGTETEVDKSADAIVEHLIRIGATDFAGGMQRQAATVAGAASNVADAWEAALDTVAQRSGVLVAQEAILRQVSETLADATPRLGDFAESLGDDLLSGAEMASIAIAKLLDILDALGVSLERKAKLLAIIAGVNLAPFIRSLAAIAEFEGTGPRESNVRAFFTGLKDDIEAARKNAKMMEGDLRSFEDSGGGAARTISAIKGELKTLNEEIRQHEEEIRKAEERIREAQTAYREWEQAIKAIEDVFDGLDMVDITSHLESQGVVLPTTAEEWRNLAEAIDLAEAALDRYGSHRDPIPLDIEGELGSSVFPLPTGDELKKIEREHEETYSQLGKQAEAVMDRAWGNIQDIAADALAEILKTGEFDFESLADAILNIFAQMLAELLVMWAINVAQRIALERTVTQSVSMGSGGGWLSALKSLFGAGGASAAAPGWGGISWAGPAQGVTTGAATTTTTSGSGGMMAGGAWGALAIGAIFAIWVGYLHSEAKKSAARKYHDVIRLSDDLNIISGAAWNEEFQQLAREARDGIRAIVDALGAEMTNFPDLKIQVQGSGKRFKAIVQGELVGIFDSYEEALEAAVLEGFSQADFSGLAPELADALERGAFDSIDQLLEVNDIFREIESSIDPVGFAIDELNTKLDVWRRKLEEVGISTEIVDDYEMRSWQEIRDNITGTTKTARELFEEERQGFNRRLQERRAEHEAAIVAAEAQHAAALAEIARLEVMLAGLQVVDEYTQRLFDQWTQQLIVANELLISSAAAAAAARDALANLPEPIGPNEFHRGGGGNRRADREQLDDMLREHDLSQLSDLAQSIQRVNDKWDDAIDLAHGDAAAIERITRARREEIEAIQDQAVDDFYGRLRRFERGPRSPLGDALAGVDNEQRDLIAGARELGEALGFTAERIDRIIGRIRDAAQEQREAILGNAAQDLLLSALEFLGRGEEAERIRFELQKAQLIIAYEELRLAAARYNIELELLATIGDIIGEIADLDFDEWRRLQTPVRNVNRGLNDTNREFDRLADRLVAAKDNIREFLNSLDRNEFGGLSPKDALDNALSQFQAVLKAAKSGDINALEAFPGISQDLLKLAREYYGSDPRFAEIFNMVREAGVALLEVSRAREGNVVFDERFYSQQQQQTDLQGRMVQLLEEDVALRRQQQASNNRARNK